MKNQSNERKKRTPINWERLISAIVITMLAISIVYVVIALTQAPSVDGYHLAHERQKSDYVLMLLQCVLGIVAMFLPGMLKKRIRLEIPSYMMILYTLFLYGAIYLGEVRNFYYVVPHWDTILHAFSGAMLGALGFSFINFLNKTDRVPMNLSPLFVVVFSFCFAITLGVLWEFYEFIADGILGTNMQKYALEGGKALMGRDALSDTMKDLIVDAIGAGVMSVIGYISIRYKKGWIEKLTLHIGKKRENPAVQSPTAGQAAAKPICQDPAAPAGEDGKEGNERTHS